MTPAITLLYAPGHRKDLSIKALASKADIVVLDLEDAVAFGRKIEAREAINEAILTTPMGRAIQVRINPYGTQFYEEDIKLMQSLPSFVAVRAPKVQAAEDVKRLQAALPGREIHALIETALGVENAFEIAKSGVASVGLGEADLRSELGLPPGKEGEAGLSWLRSRVVNAAAAAGLRAPMMSVYTNIKDDQGLFESSKLGRSYGFVGRAAIHPAQLNTIAKAFAPSDEEVARAKQVLESLAGAQDDGSGVVVLQDGSFLDAAMIRAAKSIIGISNRYTSSSI